MDIRHDKSDRLKVYNKSGGKSQEEYNRIQSEAMVDVPA